MENLLEVMLRPWRRKWQWRILLLGAITISIPCILTILTVYSIIPPIINIANFNNPAINLLLTWLISSGIYFCIFFLPCILIRNYVLAPRIRREKPTTDTIKPIETR